MKDNTSTKTLKICKASAGSGKTFTLAVEYIKHLVKDPTAYRKILAVTFTNKATAEMKQRITSQLYGISRGLDDSKDYVEKITSDNDIKAWYEQLCKKNGTTPPQLEELVRDNCRKALTMIIHDYHRFRIETIDSFFQTIIRELAHDLNLTANLKVELDQQGALKEGVSRVIEAICDNKTIRQRVLAYVSNKMEDNKNWTISSDLEKFGKNIFDENFLKFGKELREKLNNPEFMQKYKEEIDRLFNSTLRTMKESGDEFFSSCKRHGLTCEDFSNKSRNAVWSFYKKLQDFKNVKLSSFDINKTLIKHTENAENWSKDSKVQAIVGQEQWITKLKDAILQVRTYLTSYEIRRHLNQLSLINTIGQKVNDAIGDRGEFLLANTNHFLNEMIDESDVPFIYERTGTHFEHIMIDEFQDTSVLQWENFKPIIKNCLDANHECLIVGDVKQSIYRWRNGEWSILNNMGTDPQLKSFVEDDPLDTNYRSADRVITFNNRFFEKACELLSDTYANKEGGNADDIKSAYDKCEQKIPSFKEKGQGYVRIELKKELESDEDIEKWQCERIAANVEQLLKAGVPQNKIAILVRENKYISPICDYFDHEAGLINDEQVKIVSIEAYRLSSSPAVRLIILALKMLQNPEEKLFRALLTYHYQTDVQNNSSITTDFDQLFINDIESLNSFLPKELTEHVDELALTPLYELCKRLYSILSLHQIEGQDAYLFAFYDHVTHYLEGHNTDTETFLSQWDETLSEKTINDGSAEGIRIMSIHKSKGLEFHSVIIPFASWTVTNSKKNSNNLIWIKPEQSPFNESPLVPISLSSFMKLTFFADDYKKELLKQYVDSLNLLYVALTRASENLIVISNSTSKPAKDSQNKSKTKKKEEISTMFHVLSQAMPEGWTDISDPADQTFSIFEEKVAKIVGFHQKKKQTDNVMTAKPEMHQLDFSSGNSKGEFRQSNKSKRFIQGEDIDEHRTKFLDEGILFHAILSEIQTSDDVNRAVARLDMEGCFDSVSHREDVKRLVQKAFQDSRSSQWFDPKWTVINENAIIYKDGNGKISSCRPDRVITDGKETIVIDYKTGIYHSSHEEQVRGYMNLLNQMGYPNVKGFLWYIRQQSIVPVTDQTVMA